MSRYRQYHTRRKPHSPPPVPPPVPTPGEDAPPSPAPSEPPPPPSTPADPLDLMGDAFRSLTTASAPHLTGRDLYLAGVAHQCATILATALASALGDTAAALSAIADAIDRHTPGLDHAAVDATRGERAGRRCRRAPNRPGLARAERRRLRMAGGRCRPVGPLGRMVPDPQPPGW